MIKKITVKVIPRSSINQITQLSENEYKIKTTSAPVEGEANKKIISLLSKELKIPKSNIKITKGETSRNKIIEIVD